MYEGSMVGSGAVVFALMGYIITHQEFIRGTSRWVIRLNPVLIGAILGEKPGDVSEAIEFLCKPDTESTSKEQEGRRLVPMAEGSMEYWVVNGDKYQEMRDYEDRKVQNREAQRRWREKHPKPEPKEKPKDPPFKAVALAKDAKGQPIDGRKFFVKDPNALPAQP